MRKRNEKGQFSKTKVSEFGFVNLSTYTSPEVKEVNGADWIEYGADNNYFYKVNKDQYTEYDGFNNDYIVI